MTTACSYRCCFGDACHACRCGKKLASVRPGRRHRGFNPTAWSVNARSFASGTRAGPRRAGHHQARARAGCGREESYHRPPRLSYRVLRKKNRPEESGAVFHGGNRWAPRNRWPCRTPRGRGISCGILPAGLATDWQPRWRSRKSSSRRRAVSNCCSARPMASRATSSEMSVQRSRGTQLGTLARHRE